MKEVNTVGKRSTHINNLIKFNWGLASVKKLIRILFWWVTGINHTCKHTHTYTHRHSQQRHRNGRSRWIISYVTNSLLGNVSWHNLLNDKWDKTIFKRINQFVPKILKRREKIKGCSQKDEIENTPKKYFLEANDLITNYPKCSKQNLDILWIRRVL